MKVAIMQPYFFPYIGYFQLMKAVDEFVIYDNLKYCKQGWINRNRILVNGESAYITLPLKNDSDFLQIDHRFLADNWQIARKKTLNRIYEAYIKSPYFGNVFPLIEKCFNFPDCNLFNFIFNSLSVIKDYLKIDTPFIISSTIPIDYLESGENLVIEICKARNSQIYINPIGGLDLYSEEYFKIHGIDLFFLKSKELVYKQFNNEFLSRLSIIDVMMFNSPENISKALDQHDLIQERSVIERIAV